MKNIKLFSHTDLDGIGCNIILETLKIYSPSINASIENLNYVNVNDRIEEFLLSDESEVFDAIFITDISVNEKVAEILDIIHILGDVKVQLLDHHPTALWLNKYEWCKVEVESVIEKTCGTEMFFYHLYDDLKEIMFNLELANLAQLVTNIKRYDTWLWSTKYNNDTPKKLNDLFYILGKKRFIEGIIANGYSIELMLKKYELLLELQQEKIDKYIAKKNSQIINIDIRGYKVGVVFAEQFLSELGNELSKMNPQYDLIAMIGDDTISYRTVTDGVNCGEFAKHIGGGGHPKAAGSQIDIGDKMDYIERLFELNKN